MVVYEVERCGTFTLGFDHASYPRGGDEERLHVAYGEWDGDGHCYRDRPLPHAPVVNTITLVGGSFFDPQDALAFLHDPHQSWAGWLRPARRQDRWAVDVPDRTRARVGLIVAHLTEDLLKRDDYAELLHAHRARHAPARAAAHRANLDRVAQEISEWEGRREHEQLLLQRQQILIDAGRADPVGAPPPWREHLSAATPAGQEFLLATVGVRRVG
jgi:hypothetical protein